MSPLIALYSSPKLTKRTTNHQIKKVNCVNIWSLSIGFFAFMLDMTSPHFTNLVDVLIEQKDFVVKGWLGLRREPLRLGCPPERRILTGKPQAPLPLPPQVPLQCRQVRLQPLHLLSLREVQKATQACLVYGCAMPLQCNNRPHTKKESPQTPWEPHTRAHRRSRSRLAACSSPSIRSRSAASARRWAVAASRACGTRQAGDKGAAEPPLLSQHKRVWMPVYAILGIRNR